MSEHVTTIDFMIIGAGIVGLTIGRELQRTFPDAHVVIVEKEASPGLHASGRNSGVLHSGIYYPADSLKARFTLEGNKAWQTYCEENELRLDRCGKLVVARNEVELQGLDTLLKRGQVNGVEVHALDAQQAREIEPRVRTYERALFVPSTATVDPHELLEAQHADFSAAGGIVLCGYPYKGHLGNNRVQVGSERYQAGVIINCAGLHADRIAKDFGFGRRYSVLPFKGLYLYASPEASAPRAHVYPVPDLRNPFLGVHFTRTLDGSTKIGPTAIPALWREHYKGFSGYSTRDLLGIVARELHMLATNRNGFRRLAWQELKKQRRAYMLIDAADLMEGVDAMGFHKWGKPGIRAQLVDRRDNTLVMDFVTEGDAKSVHVLNAVSPAFTCAIPFAKYLVNTCLTK